MNQFGVIAGDGNLPVLLLKSLNERGFSPIVIQVTKNPSENLKKLADKTYSIGVGQIQKITRTLREHQIDRIILIGKIHKNILLRPVMLDPTALSILAKTRNKGDRAVMSAVIAHLESKGISVVRQDRYLRQLMPQAGILTQRHPSKTEWQDALYGMELARRIAELDIGQTVAVKELMPIAIEAIEGTDEAIRRAGSLVGKGITVAKAAAEGHDFRIDVPTVGRQTLAVLREVGASVLAVESERTFVMDKVELCREADGYKISIVAI